jgi:hypothetical protein
MKNIFAYRIMRAAVVAAPLLLATSTVGQAQESLFQVKQTSSQATAGQAGPALFSKSFDTNSEWDVYVYPILAWVPIMGIDVTVPETPSCQSCPRTEASDSANSGLNGAAFVNLRIEKGRFAGELGFNYAGLFVEHKSPFIHVETSALAGAVFGGVRVWNKLYVEGGARYQGLDIRVRLLDFDEVRWQPGQWQPVIGTTFHPALGKHWNVYAHVDASVGSSLIKTVNGSFRAEWRPASVLILSAGYGFTTLKVNETIGSAVFDASYTLHGPIVGIGIKM